MKNGTDLYFINKYIKGYFNSGVDKLNTNTFFGNEVEYILYGKLNDAGNKEAFLNDFKRLRLLINSAYLYADTEKRAAILALAEVLTPGPAALATAIALTEAWALAESMNDVKLLEIGENVSFIKTDATWALGIEAATSGLISKDGIRPSVTDGLSYSEYLQLFLAFLDEGTKMVRMMDLIQLNIKGNVNHSFNVKYCYVGLEYEAQINGKRYRYVQKY